MLAAIPHRGPDALGTHAEPGIGLGAVRLAIIDLLRGDQPLFSEDGSVCVVYNGEIYNYRELQSRLRARGHNLASETDSETLPHLFEDHGIDLVHELNGMFAFAVWDSRRKTLHLARDRFGVKPLYYTWDGTTLAFGSEVKCLLRAGTRAALDPNGLVELLTFQNIISDQSLFAGVSVLPAGSVLTLDADSRLSIDQYWEPMPRPDPGLDPASLSEEVAVRFVDAVERQLVSDVEIASYLSGGLDTGAVTAAAAPGLGRLTTFSTGFDVSDATGMEAGFDERADAARLAAELGTHHHELVLDHHDMEMVLPRLVRHLEEPRMSFSYPNYLTAGFASRWVKVVLSGCGGDEMFGGYPWRYAMADEPDFPESYFGLWTRLLSQDEMREGFRPELLAEMDLERPRAVFDEAMAPASDLPPLDQVLFFESKTYLHGLLIVEDKLNMAHSLESRVPFLDNDLVDYCLTVPAELKLETGRSKDLFRRAMVNLLPEEVRTRKKTGFTPPQAAWFRSGQADYLAKILLSDRARERGVLRPEFAERLLREHRTGESDRRLVLWTLLCVEWWQRIFIDGEHTI